MDRQTEQIEQVFFNVPLLKLEPIFKRWVREVFQEKPQITQLTEQPDQLLTIEQTAEFLNLTKPTIYSLVSRNEIPFMKRSKRLYFSRVELINYLKQGRKKTNSEVEAEAQLYLLNRKRK